MIGRPNRMAVAGFVGMVILVVAALVLPMDGDRLAAYRSVYGHDESPRTEHSSSGPDESARQADQSVATEETSDADIAFILQSVRDSLHRNDLASAKVLLDAVLAVRHGLPEALALKKDLDVREAREAKAMASVVATAPASESAHDDSLNRVADKKDQTADQRVAQSADQSVDEAADQTDLAAKSSTQQSGRVQAQSASRDTPEHSTQHERLASADRTHTKTRHTAHVTRHHPAAHLASGRPKTRVEVISELKHARAHGSMPRYGNSSPYGPAGSPYQAAR